MKSRRPSAVRIPAATLLLVAAGLAAQTPAPAPATSQARVPVL